MKLADGYGIKAPRWLANEIVTSNDVNNIHEFTYKNVVDAYANILASAGANSASPDIVSGGGLRLVWDSGMNVYLQPGAVVSFQGRYFSGSTWGFTAESGSVFGAVVGSAALVAFDGGGALDRYDTLEIRPIQTLYDSQSRKFRDPVTGIITTTPAETKIEYGYEYQILKGTEGAGVAPTHTSGWIKVAEVFVGSGVSALTADDIFDVTRSSVWTAEAGCTTYREVHMAADAYVDSQESFNALWERTSANNYKIKDYIKSVFIRNIGVGYDCYSGASFLSGGDTYAIMDFNNALAVKMEAGAYLYVGDSAGYVNVSLSYSEISGVWVKGLGTTAVSAPASISLDTGAVGCTLTLCKVSNRKVNNGHVAFHDQSAGLLNNSALACVVSDMEATLGNFYGFSSFRKMSNCLTSNISGTGTGGAQNVVAFFECSNISGCQVYDISTAYSSSAIIGFQLCTNISACKISNCSTTGEATGFLACTEGSGCSVSSITASSVCRGFGNGCKNMSGSLAYYLTGGGTAFGFTGCEQISASKAIAIFSATAYGFYQSEQLTGCKTDQIEGTTNASAFHTCYCVSGCYAYQVTGVSNAYGFYGCSRVSACRVQTIVSTVASGVVVAAGFYMCSFISACDAVGISVTSGSGVANGFMACTYVSSCYTAEPANAGNDFVDTPDTNVSTNYSCPDTVWQA